MGVDWFRQYLVIEFAEEGLDLLTAIHEMLDRNRSKMEEELHQDVVKGEREGGAGGEAGDAGAKDDEQRGVERGTQGGEGAGVVVPPAAEREGGRVVAAAEAEAKPEGGGGGGEEGQGEEFDLRKSAKDIFGRFIKSGCGAECNLPGTIVSKVSRCFVRGGLRRWRVTVYRSVLRDIFSRKAAASLTLPLMSALGGRGGTALEGGYVVRRALLRRQRRFIPQQAQKGAMLP